MSGARFTGRLVGPANTPRELESLLLGICLPSGPRAALINIQTLKEGQLVKGPVTTPDDLSLIPRYHVIRVLTPTDCTLISTWYTLARV